MIRDHFLTMALFTVLVAFFFATLNHRDRRGFWISFVKTTAWMILGAVAFGYLMFWTGR